MSQQIQQLVSIKDVIDVKDPTAGIVTAIVVLKPKWLAW